MIIKTFKILKVLWIFNPASKDAATNSKSLFNLLATLVGSKKTKLKNRISILKN